ncbi:5'-3' exonuclease [Solanum tuberosum]|nr:PREDICTED: 5'-3' exonuclease [Solanum tuberosum]XP_015165855.1 PREDICTED: 5'-3' exonuclease [Solanum tuberosum]
MEIQQFPPFTITPRHFHPIPNSTHHPVLVSPLKQQRNLLKLSPLFCSSSSSHSHPVVQDPILQQGNEPFGKSRDTHYKNSRKKRVFFLDVNPICYKGSIPSLQSFAHWISLFFSQVSLTDPVIAVIDGERGNEYRRQLLPSYKASRRKYWHQLQGAVKSPRSTIERSHRLILDVLQNCNVPVVKIESHEADDVIATLVEQVIQRGHRVVVASPDKDFKQLISDDVQIVMPVPEFNRWSFYTLKHYVAQYNCDPRSDLSLRCMLGDEVDGVPGIQHVVPGFGRKTALKLLKKHGTLENLLNAASVRSVGRQYAQDALIKYADYLRRNYEVLSLKRDVGIHIEEQWLNERDARNDSLVLSNFVTSLKDSRNLNSQNRSHSIG